MNVQATLDDLIAQLEIEAELANERLNAARQLRATYPDAQAAPPDTTPTQPEPPQPAPADDNPKPAPKRAAAKSLVACPDCGQRMKPQGLGPHRARLHGYLSPRSKTTKKSDERAAPKASRPKVGDTKPGSVPIQLHPPYGGKVLRCSQAGCGAEFEDIVLLTRHCATKHERYPYRDERMLVDPAEVAA